MIGHRIYPIKLTHSKKIEMLEYSNTKSKKNPVQKDHEFLIIKMDIRQHSIYFRLIQLQLEIVSRL